MVAGSSEGGSPDPLTAVRDPGRLEAVRETGLHEPQAPDSLGYLTSLARRTLDCSTAFVSVVDSDRVLVRASRGEPEPILEDGYVPIEESFCQNVVASGSPLVVRDADEAESVGSGLAARHGLLSYLEVPVYLTEDTVLGGFCVGEPAPRDWTDEDVDLLETFAAGAASEIRLRRKVRLLEKRESELEARALRDALTGLANRHLLWDRVNHALARAERSGSHVAILFLDVDDFKSVNDRHGHTAGDRVLAEIGRRLRDTVREHDTAARFGGDEFVILLEDLVDPSHAGRIADRIDEALRPPMETDEGSVTLSLSMGVSVAGGGADDDDGDAGAGTTAGGGAGGDPPSSRLASRGRRLLQEADWAMYRAKRSEETTWARY